MRGSAPHVTARPWKGAAEAALSDLARLFPGRVYVELMRHGLEAEARIEGRLTDLAFAHDLPQRLRDRIEGFTCGVLLVVRFRQCRGELLAETVQVGQQLGAVRFVWLFRVAQFGSGIGQCSHSFSVDIALFLCGPGERPRISRVLKLPPYVINIRDINEYKEKNQEKDQGDN